MITKLSVATIYVLDKDEALDSTSTNTGSKRDPFGNAIRILQQG